MTNARVTAAGDALKLAIRDKDGDAVGEVLADLARTDPGAAAQICEELTVRGLNRMVYGTPAGGS